MILRFSADNFQSSAAPEAGSTGSPVALRTMADFVLRSTVFSESDYGRHYPAPRVGDGPPKPTLLEIELLIHTNRYRYAFAYDARRIVSERLFVIEGLHVEKWFERLYHPETHTENWAPFSPELTGPCQMWRDATRPEALFLSTAGSLNSIQLAPLLMWFQKTTFEVAEA